jgi:hypothetical protein
VAAHVLTVELKDDCITITLHENSTGSEYTGRFPPYTLRMKETITKSFDKLSSRICKLSEDMNVMYGYDTIYHDNDVETVTFRLDARMHDVTLKKYL